MKKLLSLGPLFVIIAALLWSLDGLLRRSLFVLPPSVIVFWEHMLGAVLLLPLLLIKGSEIKKLTVKEWKAIIIVSLFSGALGTIFYTAALGKVNFIQFSVVVLLQQLQPIWAIAAGTILLKEKITPNYRKWATVALVAAYFVSFKDLVPNFQTGSGTIIAAVFALLAGVMWGTSTAFSKIVLNKVSFAVATLLRFLLAPIFALIIIVGLHQTPSLFVISQPQWLTLLAITFSTGMVALLVYYYGLKLTPVKVTTICELVWPASAIFIDYFYFHKVMSGTQLVATGVLLLAIYKVTQTRK